MEIYCVKCRKKTDTINILNINIKNNKNQVKGQCKICNTNKSQFVKKSDNLNIISDLKINNKIENNNHNLIYDSESNNLNSNSKINNNLISDSETSKNIKIISDSETKNKSILEKIYYDPKTGFSGINDLKIKSGLPVKVVKEFLNQQDTYTLHKPAQKNFERERVFVHDIDEQWQSDLVEMIPYAEENNNFKYLLTIIDCFSKYAWAIPIKNKTGEETVRGFEIVFKNRKPIKIQTDQGKEYYNSKLNNFFKQENINHFSSKSPLKAQICERFNRTLKEKMWKIFTENNNHKWIHILDDLLKNYNNSKHSSIKMTPNEASKPENKQIVYNNLYKNKTHDKNIPKFKIGDKVRITKYKNIFDKGYLPNWTTETFIINKVFETDPITYEIKDLADEIIEGKFYNEELILYDNKNDIHKVEKILKRRTKNGVKEVFVKWYEYPDKFNSWELESNIIKK